jgi:hypothetical protein
MKVDKEWDMHHIREYKCIQNISHYTWKTRALGRYCQWWEKSIKMDIREVGYEGVDLILVAEEVAQCQTIVNTGICLCVPWKVGCILSSRVSVPHEGLCWQRMWSGGRHLCVPWTFGCTLSSWVTVSQKGLYCMKWDSYMKIMFLSF